MPLVHAYLAGRSTAKQKAAYLRAADHAACTHLGTVETSAQVWITPISDHGYMKVTATLAELRAAAGPRSSAGGRKP